jgi:hypothetical protein
VIPLGQTRRLTSVSQSLGGFAARTSRVCRYRGRLNIGAAGAMVAARASTIASKADYYA